MAIGTVDGTVAMVGTATSMAADGVGVAAATGTVVGAVVGAGAVGAGVGAPASISAPAMVDAGLQVMAGCLAAAGGGKAVMKSAGRLLRPASLAASGGILRKPLLALDLREVLALDQHPQKRKAGEGCRSA
jgi:hypothetical protein